MALIALAGLLAGAGVVRSRLDGWTRDWLEERLAQRLGGEVRIGSLKLTLRRLEAELREVRVEVPAADAPPLSFELRRARLRSTWRGLRAATAGRIRISELVLDAPSLTLTQQFLERRERRGGRPQALALRIDRLEIRDGRVRYDDRETPLELEAENLHADGVWDPDLRAVVADVGLESTLLRAPFVKPLPVALDGRLRWQGLSAELPETVLRAPGLELQGSWTIDASREAWLEAEVTASADLERLSAWLDPVYSDSTGAIRGPLSLRAGGEPPRVEGRLDGTGLRLLRFELDALSADLAYQSGTLRLDGLDGRAYGGQVGGALTFELGTPRSFEAAIDGRGLELAALFEMLGRPLPFSGATEVSLRLAGDPGEPAGWTGRGTATSGPPHQTPGIPTTGAAEFRFEPGRLLATAAGLQTGAARIDLALELALFSDTPGGTIDVRGLTASAGATQSDTRRIMERLEVPVPTVLEQPLTGRGPFTARIEFGPRDGVELTLALRDGGWAGQQFDQAELALALRDGRLEVERIHAVSADREVEGSFSMRLGETTLEAARVTARNLELQPILALAMQSPLELGGTLSGRLEAARGPRGLVGRGQAALAGVQWLGERFDEVTAEIELADGLLRLAPAAARGPAVEASGHAEVDLERGGATIVLERGLAGIERLELVRGRELDARGSIAFRGDVVLDADGLSGGVIALESDDATLSGRGVGRIEGELALGPEVLNATLAGPPGTGWTLVGRLGLADETLPVEATLTLDGTIVELMAAEVGRVWARLSGDARVEGPLSDPARLAARARVERAELNAGTKVLHAEAPFTVELEQGRLATGPVGVAGDSFRLQTELAVELESRVLRARARGGLDMGVLAALVPNLRATGVADLDVEVAGTVDAPEPMGTVRLAQGRARLLGFPHTLEQIGFDLRFDRDTARLDAFRGVLGGGEVRAQGEAAIAGGALGDYRLDLDGAGLRISYPEGFRGVYDATLTLEARAGRHRLSGNVEMLRGLWRQEFDLFQLAGVGVREYEATDETPLPDVELDVRLRATENVWLRNELAEVESQFDLQVAGDLNRPEVTGRLQLLEGGKLRFRDVDYRITSGALTFLDVERINPYLDLRAETTVGIYEVFLHVEGTIERFEYELTSNPSLSPQDIIALLTTGRTLQELTTRSTAGEGVFAGDLAASYFAGALTDRFEKQLQRLLGLERLRIDPLLVGERADPTARITLGKEVADNLFVIASTRLDASERQLYQIEWQASRNLQLTAERGTTGGIGGELRYTDRFWLRRPEVRREPAVPAVGAPAEPAADGRRRVAAVVVEGVPAEDARELRRRIPLEEGDAFTRSGMFEGAEAVRRFYVRRGRIRAEVRSTLDDAPDGRIRLVYSVEPGPETRVELRGVEGKHAKAIRRLLEAHWIESIWGEDLYQEAAEQIRDYYQGRGFYTADVHVTERHAGGDQAVIFTVDAGKPVRVRTIRIRGAEGVDVDRIRRQILTRPGTFFARRQLVPSVLDEDMAAIRNLYRDQGYLKVRVEDPRVQLAADGETAGVTLTIQEGPRFVVERVEVPEGLPFGESEVVGWSGLSAGDVFSPRKLLAAESALRGSFDGRGYPDAKVRGQVELLEGSVVVRFDIAPGAFKRVGEIEIVGNTRTKRRIVRRELLFDQGDQISRDRVLRSQHQLYKLGIFRSVQIDYLPLDGDDPSLYRLRVKVQEERPIGMAVGAGFDS